MSVMTRPSIVATLEAPLNPGWNALPGVTTLGETVTIEPDEYFFRYENPKWLLCDWEGVRDELVPAEETNDIALEQRTLEYIKKNSKQTTSPEEVLRTAEKTYAYIFRDDHLADPDLASMGVTEKHLQMLREMGTMMALNRVDESGHPSNVGPAWFFPAASQKVYGLNDEESGFLDELYHGSFFNESRRVESIKAHAALGGRLVHGCQSVPCQSGGCVVAYGTNIANFTKELAAFKDEWMEAIRLGRPAR